MKPKKPGRKLALSKTTVANLEAKEQNAAKGGYLETEINTGCGTWHPICYTMPESDCYDTIPPFCTRRISVCAC